MKPLSCIAGGPRWRRPSRSLAPGAEAAGVQQQQVEQRLLIFGALAPVGGTNQGGILRDLAHVPSDGRETHEGRG
jgi:hypothetical protein